MEGAQVRLEELDLVTICSFIDHAPVISSVVKQEKTLQQRDGPHLSNKINHFPGFSPPMSMAQALQI
jgi:hypothetical protein